MMIDHPLLGPRDAAEFVYKGDAALIHRPDGLAEGALRAYANRWAATPAQEIAVFTNNDDGHAPRRTLRPRASRSPP